MAVIVFTVLVVTITVVIVICAALAASKKKPGMHGIWWYNPYTSLYIGVAVALVRHSWHVGGRRGWKFSSCSLSCDLFQMLLSFYWLAM